MLKTLPIKYLLPGSLLWVLILLSGCFSQTQATHIRAGDITAKRDTTPNPNPRRFFFTMNIYRNTEATANDPEAVISMGDGNQVTVQRSPVIPIGNRTEIQVFKWSYTYAANGTYTISWNGINRNGGIQNIAPPSDQVTFFISTTININPLRGYNSTPVLTVFPIDLAAVGRIFVHNPGAYDADGDSLAFKLRVPQRIGVGNTPTDVPGYSLPDRTFPNCRNSTDSGPAFLTLDLNNGQLVWDAPCRKGEYNVAFVVEEWRVTPGGGAVKLGEVVRDMQILVEETPNRPPVLTPKDTCIVAGTTLNATIRATDPDNDLITLTAISGIIPPATFRQTTNVRGLAAGPFSWTTSCTDVRERPYQVIFRAEDVRPPVDIKLSDLQPWNITVIGPAPQNLSVTGQDRNVVLNWDRYTCQNASTIRIYRREGASGFVPGYCETGVPARTGYVLIGEVPKDQTTFTDTNNGQGLTAGVNYCYIIYAEFPAPGRGKSLASNEACMALEQDIPYLTNVTVDATSPTAGQITVRWTKPLVTTNLTPPFQYRLLRKTGQAVGGGAYTVVKTITNLNDTTHVDNNLNTLENGYRYKLEFYHSQNPGGPANVFRDSTSASSVRLAVEPATGTEAGAVLTWNYIVPWRNEVLRHHIYRRIDGAFVLIDSVMATSGSGTYTDRGTFNGGTGLQRGTQYCYYVETRGTYQLPRLPEPLRNRSQEFCILLPKLICAPELSIDQLDCEAFLDNPTPPPYQNVLTWVPNITGDCTDEIDFYTVYFRGPGEEVYREVGTNIKGTTFTHTGLESYAGCYVVTATDVNGNESEYSNEVCKDNCISFMLPNIITPNGDGLNDVFRPDQRTLFIRSMKFTVYNRWGVKVYEGTEPYINWAGTNSEGKRLTDGTYYYEADVQFFTIDPAKERAKYKGWVEIVR